LKLFSSSLSRDAAEELVELARLRCPQCPAVSISRTGWDDGRIERDATVVADAGPRGMVEANQQVRSKGLGRIE
jgi:hypothetical protein